MLLIRHTRGALHPARKGEDESETSNIIRVVRGTARLAIDGGGHAGGQVDGAEEALAERRRGGRVEVVPGIEVRVRDAGWRVFVQGRHVERWGPRAGGGEGVCGREGHVELAAVGAGGDVLEGHELVDAVGDAAGSDGLGDFEVAVGAGVCAPEAGGVGLVQLLHEEWVYCCAAPRG
jgi:hypothetical protein